MLADSFDELAAKIAGRPRATVDDSQATPVRELDVPATVDEVIAAFSSGHDAFEGIAHEDLNVTTMLYNNGTVFTNMWYTWTGKARATGEAVAIKGYCWMMWEGDQVVALYNAFDPTRYNEALAGDS